MRDQHDIKAASMDMSTLIGYTHVSTTEQFLEMQIDALKKTEYHQVFTGMASGARVDRPGLDKALEYLCDGDTLIAWKIDHLGHSLTHLVQIIDALCGRDVGFRPLTDTEIDMITRNGKLLFDLFATLVEFGRDLISERTKASLTVAKARGRSDGRRATVTLEKLAKAHRLMDKKGLMVKETTVVLDVDRLTSYRALNAKCDTPTEDDEQGGPETPRSLAR